MKSATLSTSFRPNSPMGDDARWYVAQLWCFIKK